MKCYVCKYHEDDTMRPYWESMVSVARDVSLFEAYYIHTFHGCIIEEEPFYDILRQHYHTPPERG